VEIEPPGAAAGLGKAEAIERAYRDDLPLLVRYNLADARWHSGPRAGSYLEGRSSLRPHRHHPGLRLSGPGAGAGETMAVNHGYRQ